MPAADHAVGFVLLLLSALSSSLEAYPCCFGYVGKLMHAQLAVGLRCGRDHRLPLLLLAVLQGR